MSSWDVEKFFSPLFFINIILMMIMDLLLLFFLTKFVSKKSSSSILKKYPESHLKNIVYTVSDQVPLTIFEKKWRISSIFRCIFEKFTCLDIGRDVDIWESEVEELYLLLLEMYNLRFDISEFFWIDHHHHYY